MDQNQFEQALFAHLEKESLVLTPINVGAAMQLDTDDAARLLEQSAATGKLERVSGHGNTATYRQPGRPAYGASPGESAVKPAVKDGNINQLVLNFVFPGLGSLMAGNWLGGVIPILLLLGGAIAMVVVLPGAMKTLALIPVGVAWVWSVVVGFIGYFGSRSLK